MPKRPCSVALTPDQSTILCADKFGDVYALPLLESRTSSPTSGLGESDALIDPKAEAKTKAFIPSASALTVHTQRNQRALKNQQNTVKMVAEKKFLDFDYQLLLGHVSLLTDLVYVTLRPDQGASTSTRSYILTSDRDEHIRISRGLPQAHVIEGYCLEHNEFVSKLCVPLFDPEMLISGGGDDYILVWDWVNRRVKQKIDIKHMVSACGAERVAKATFNDLPDAWSDTRSNESLGSVHLAVSGIWAMETESVSLHGTKGQIIVACEG